MYKSTKLPNFRFNRIMWIYYNNLYRPWKWRPRIKFVNIAKFTSYHWKRGFSRVLKCKTNIQKLRYCTFFIHVYLQICKYSLYLSLICCMLLSIIFIIFNLCNTIINKGFTRLFSQLSKINRSSRECIW